MSNVKGDEANLISSFIQASRERTAPRSSAELPRPRVPRRARTKRLQADGRRWDWSQRRPGADDAGSDNSGSTGGAKCYWWHTLYHDHDDDGEEERNVENRKLWMIFLNQISCFLPASASSKTTSHRNHHHPSSIGYQRCTLTSMDTKKQIPRHVLLETYICPQRALGAVLQLVYDRDISLFCLHQLPCKPSPYICPPLHMPLSMFVDTAFPITQKVHPARRLIAQRPPHHANHPCTTRAQFLCPLTKRTQGTLFTIPCQK